MATGYTSSPSGETGLLLGSQDGVEWHAAAVGDAFRDVRLYDVATVGPRIYLTGQSRPCPLPTCPDGAWRTWSSDDGRVYLEMSSTRGVEVGRLRVIGSELFAIGRSPKDKGSPVLWRLVDGAWDVVLAPGRPAPSILGVVPVGGRLMAVGSQDLLSDDVPRGAKPNVIWMSDDSGASWCEVEWTGPPFPLVAVAESGGLVVALGSHGMGASADPSGFIVETRDGSTWRETGDRHQFEDTGLSAIVGSPDGWVVVGTVGMGDSAITTSWQSLDGIDWRPLGNLGPPADRIVVGLARSQDRLVAATFEIEPASTGATFPTRLFSLRATSTP